MPKGEDPETMEQDNSGGQPQELQTPAQEPENLEAADILRGLEAEVRDQDELERNINRQADQMLTDQANERDQKRLEKARLEKRFVFAD